MTSPRLYYSQVAKPKLKARPVTLGSASGDGWVVGQMINGWTGG